MQASDALELLDMVAGLGEELLEEPMADEASLLCVDASGQAEPLEADLDVARRAVVLRMIVGPA